MTKHTIDDVYDLVEEIHYFEEEETTDSRGKKKSWFQKIKETIDTIVTDVTTVVTHVGALVKGEIMDGKKAIARFVPHAPRGYKEITKSIGRIDDIVKDTAALFEGKNADAAELARAKGAFDALKDAFDAYNQKHGLPVSKEMENFLTRFNKVGTATQGWIVGLMPDVITGIDDAAKIIQAQADKAGNEAAWDPADKRQTVMILGIISGVLSAVPAIFTADVKLQAEGGVSAGAEVEAGVIVGAVSLSSLLLIPKIVVDAVITHIDHSPTADWPA
ncbi:MAG: hypothetical protein AAGL23_10470 [Pseudomonadota bacterium]